MNVSQLKKAEKKTKADAKAKKAEQPAKAEKPAKSDEKQAKKADKPNTVTTTAVAVIPKADAVVTMQSKPATTATPTAGRYRL